MRETLEEQIAKAKAEDKREYAQKMLRALQGERTKELYDELAKPPMFVDRDAVRLLSEIMAGYENGEPVTAKYVRKPENAPAFAYLAFLQTVKVEERRCYLFFKRKIIVPTP